jgi:hypothetical protein
MRDGFRGPVNPIPSYDGVEKPPDGESMTENCRYLPVVLPCPRSAPARWFLADRYTVRRQLGEEVGGLSSTRRWTVRSKPQVPEVKDPGSGFAHGDEMAPVKGDRRRHNSIAT